MGLAAVVRAPCNTSSWPFNLLTSPRDQASSPLQGILNLDHVGIQGGEVEASSLPTPIGMHLAGSGGLTQEKLGCVEDGWQAKMCYLSPPGLPHFHPSGSCHCSLRTLRSGIRNQALQTLDTSPASWLGLSMALWRRRPTSTLSRMFTAQLSLSAVLLNAHFYTFLYFLQSFYTAVSIWIYIITRREPLEMYVIMVCLLSMHMPQLSHCVTC